MELTFALVPTLATALLAIALALALAVSVSLFQPALLFLVLGFLFSQFGSCFQVSRHCWFRLFALEFLAANCWPSTGYRCQTTSCSPYGEFTPFPLRFADVSAADQILD